VRAETWRYHLCRTGRLADSGGSERRPRTRHTAWRSVRPVSDCDTSHTLGDLRGFWLLSATVALFALLAIGVAVSLATDENTSAKVPKPASNEASLQNPCAQALLKDWSDGRIDGTYPLTCYRVALKSLPVDIQVYSSASDDISQALSQRIVQSAEERSTKAGARRPAG
jgi:hypothetical protein